MLAGMSADYYTRLEQGREQHPSEAVLDALAKALELESEARSYLHSVAAAGVRLHPKRPDREPVSPMLLSLIDQWRDTPALIVDRLLNVVAGNQLGQALHAGYRYSDSLTRFVFLEEAAKAYYDDWEYTARRTVAALRSAAGADPDDPELVALVGELSLGSNEFRQLWAGAEVRRKTRARVTLHHREVGTVHLLYESLTINASPDYELKIYQAVPDTGTADALALLGSLAAASVAD